MEIRKARVKYEDGTYSQSYPIGVNSNEVDLPDGENLANEIISINNNIQNINNKNIEQDSDIASLQEQIRENRNKIDAEKLINENQARDILKLKRKGRTFVYDTVEDMKADEDLSQGDVAITLGYYEPNDGGGAKYLIRNKINDDIEDNGSIYFLNDILVAEIIIENNTINIKQLGARPQDIQNNKYDIHDFLIKYMNILDKFNFIIKLYIPTGIWYTSPITVARNKGFYIFGDKVYGFDKGQGTIITAINNQDYVFNLGNNLIYTQNWTLENLIFSTAQYSYNSTNNRFEKTDFKIVNNQVMKILYCSFGIFNDIFFLEINGQALSVSSCWEIYSNNITFRRISNIEGSIMCFDTKDTSLLNSANITACQFNKLFFEAVHGDLIETKDNNELYNCHIGTINFEDYLLERNNVEYTSYTDENAVEFENDNTAKHYAIVAMSKGAFNITIDSIDLNNISTRFFTVNNKKYSYDTIFSLNDNYCYLGSTVNSISIAGMKKNLRLLKMDNGILPYIKSKLCINSIVNNSDYFCYFDCHGFTYIECHSDLAQTENIIHNILANNYTPFYTIAKVRKTLNRGFLYYDENSRTPLKLCCKMLYKQGFENFQIIPSSKELIIHAKIDDGETLNFTLYDTISQKSGTLSLVGDGTFKDYTLDITNFCDIGNVCNIGLNSSSSEINHFLDYFRFN